jgi:hypothetical protein
MLYGNVFLIENGEVIINEHILNIGVLRAVKEFYKDPLPAFKFLRYKYDPESPFFSVPEEEKDQVLMDEFPGEYTLEDEVMNAAVEWIESRITPKQRYLLDCKRLLERIGQYGRVTEIDSGRDGNISAFLTQVRTMGKTVAEFAQVEKIVEMELEEIKSRNRGNTSTGFRED